MSVHVVVRDVSPPAPPPEREVTITMPYEHARTLRHVLWRVHQSAHMNDVFEALHAGGVHTIFEAPIACGNITVDAINR